MRTELLMPARKVPRVTRGIRHTTKGCIDSDSDRLEADSERDDTARPRVDGARVEHHDGCEKKNKFCEFHRSEILRGLFELMSD